MLEESRHKSLSFVREVTEFCREIPYCVQESSGTVSRCRFQFAVSHTNNPDKTIMSFEDYRPLMLSSFIIILLILILCLYVCLYEAAGSWSYSFEVPCRY